MQFLKVTNIRSTQYKPFIYLYFIINKSFKEILSVWETSESKMVTLSDGLFAYYTFGKQMLLDHKSDHSVTVCKYTAMKHQREAGALPLFRFIKS